MKVFEQISKYLNSSSEIE